MWDSGSRWVLHDGDVTKFAIVLVYMHTFNQFIFSIFRFWKSADLPEGMRSQKKILLLTIWYEIKYFVLNQNLLLSAFISSYKMFLLQLMCMYAEFLLRSLRSPASAHSYLSAVSTLHVWLSQDIGVFSSAPLRQFWKAVDLTVRYFPNSKLPLTLPQLRILLSGSCTLGKFAVVFRALLSLTFFTMVRISSFLPLHPRQLVYFGTCMTCVSCWMLLINHHCHLLRTRTFTDLLFDLTPSQGIFNFHPPAHLDI